MPYNNKEDRNKKLREKRLLNKQKVNSVDECNLSEITDNSSNENSIISIQYEELKEKYNELKKRYENLENKHENLQKEFNAQQKEFYANQYNLINKLVEKQNAPTMNREQKALPKVKPPTPEEKRLEKLKKIENNTMSIEEFMGHFEIKEEEFNLTGYYTDEYGRNSYIHKETCITKLIVNRVIQKCNDENKFMPIQAFNLRPAKYYVRVEEQKESYNDKYIDENKKWIYCDNTFIFKIIKNYINGIIGELLKRKDEETKERYGEYTLVEITEQPYDVGERFQRREYPNPNAQQRMNEHAENNSKYAQIKDECVNTMNTVLLPLFKMKE